MRASKYTVIGMALALLVLTATQAVASSAAQRLTTPAAREVAATLVEKAVKRSPRLETADFRECDWRLRRIDCLFVTQGQTANATFDCRFKVVVRRGHRHLVGRIVARACEVAPQPVLTAARATEAIAAVAEARMGPEAPVVVLRQTRSRFLGYAASPPDNGPPVCVLKLSAELLPTGLVRVQTHGLSCDV